MPLFFQSICSGSSGNCLLFQTGSTRVFIDCGLPSQKRIRKAMHEHAGGPEGLDAVVISHAHTDHVNYSALRVMEKEQIPLLVHEHSAGLVRRKHDRGLPFDGLRLETFDNHPFQIGDIELEPVEVPHHPSFQTFGFVVRALDGHNLRKAVVVTDCMDWSHAGRLFHDAGLVYVEANHDPELLRLRPNPNSRFHMVNAKTGRLLSEVLTGSDVLPRNVMLGHLSAERNTPDIALDTVTSRLERKGVPLEFSLLTAPRFEPSPLLEV